MKTRLLIIFTIIGISLIIPQVWAPSNEPSFYGFSHFKNMPILHPEETKSFLIKLENADKFTLYDVTPKIEVWPQESQPFVTIKADSIPMLESGKIGTINATINADSRLPINDLRINAYFTTKDKDGTIRVGGGSEHINNIIKVERLLSPLKQLKLGIEPKDIVCKQRPVYYELVMKKSNGQPVCVKGTSVKTLTLRNYIPEYNGSLGGEIPSNDSEPLIESRHIEITGVINHWQPIDGPAYSLIIDEPINAQVSDMGIFLYGDMLRPYMKDQTVTIKGMLIPNYVEYQRSLGFSIMSGDPSTATILVDEIQIQQESKLSKIEELLIQNQIDYLPDKLVVTGGPVIQGDSGCGAVIDADSTTHWFIINSISNPKNMTLYSENPGMCDVRGASCFCNAQIELTALTLKELSYFTIQEEEKYSNILIDYLGKENINRTTKFMIGKLNLNYTDFSAIGYCGKMWGENDYGFFSGAIANDRVKNYGIDKELPKLCAISNDAQYFGKAFGEKENEN
jgi:hypothetical protein